MIRYKMNVVEIKDLSVNAQKIMAKRIKKAKNELRLDEIALRISKRWVNGRNAVDSTGITSPYDASGEISKLRDKYGECLFPRRKKGSRK